MGGVRSRFYRGDILAIRLDDVFTRVRPSHHIAAVVRLHEHIVWPSPLRVIYHATDWTTLSPAHFGVRTGADCW